VDRPLFVEPDFFDVFSFPLRRGASQHALAESNSIVLTPSVARQVFGDDDPLGHALQWRKSDTTLALTVTGVAEELPFNTSLSFDALLSFTTKPRSRRDPSSWDFSQYQTFAVLQSPEAFDALPDSPSILTGKSDGREMLTKYFSVPLTALHLSNVSDSVGFTGKWQYLYLVGAFALAVLFVACVNYVNLATARATRRAKEVGIRKVAGATRFQIARQFLGESVLLALGAFVFALLLAEAALPAFNSTFETQLNLAYGEHILFLGLLAGLVVAVGLAAGSYPAFYLSAFEPTHVLRGRAQRKSSAWLRKGLVGGQFALSTILLIGGLVIHHQLDYMQTADLGFDEERLVSVDLSGVRAWKQREALRRDVLAAPGVMAATVANVSLGQFWTWSSVEREAASFSSETQGGRNRAINFSQGVVDYQFVETLDLELIAGRSFSQERPSDEKSAYLLNRAAAEALGWTPEEAVGRPFDIGRNEGSVIGTLENFHIRSLHAEIPPIAVRLHTPAPQPSGKLMARLAPGTTGEALSHIEQKLAQYTPSAAFEYQFVEDAFSIWYRPERRIGRVVGAVTAVAILLACMGLFGLAAYAAEQRTKEIGIRKAFGASVPSIVALLSGDFLKPLGIAFVIAAPLAFLIMQQWLDGFAYRIDSSLWTYLLAGATIFVVALLAVSYQAGKAALANPVESLRHE
jgi:putative ABC transport system permease protein